MSGRTVRKGYGQAHQRLRRGWAPQVASGLCVCYRCGEPIAPGAPWDLGHDDQDRTKYRGPEHRACNRSTWHLRTRKPTDPKPNPVTEW